MGCEIFRIHLKHGSDNFSVLFYKLIFILNNFLQYTEQERLTAPWRFHYSPVFGFSSSCMEVLCKKFVIKNFVKFTGKHLRRSLFLNTVADLRPTILLRKRLRHRCFSVNFAKVLKKPFLQNSFWRLLDKLNVVSQRIIVGL